MHGYCAGMPSITFRLCQPMEIVVMFSFSLFLHPLPRIPKLYIPSVACPVCSYSNYENFRFCQQCGCEAIC